MKEDLAKRLRSMRSMLDLTQSALADRVGITQAYLAELEKGAKRPSIDVLEKLCGTLNCSADYLLGLSDSKSYTAHEEPLPTGLKGRGVPHDVLRVMAERNVSSRELVLALDFVKKMQDENARK
ncbi:MAG: helix-turn-helix transcriptional regulator [Bacillota bacterium]